MDPLIKTQVIDHTHALDLAIREHQAGRTTAAEAGYRQILDHDSHQPDALHLLGMLACDRGDGPGALSMIDVAIGLQPDRAAFHNTRGRALAVTGCLKEAESAYRAAWSLRPDTMEIANNLGCLLRDQGDISGALFWLHRANVLAPDSAEVLGNLAQTLASGGQSSVCLPLFRDALLRWPNSAAIHHAYGRLLLSLGRLAEAEESYRAAVRLRSDYAASRNELGLVLVEQGRIHAAVQCFGEVVRRDPHCADAHYNLGCLLQLENNIDEARACHERAIDADNLHGPALWARCMVELPVLYQSADQIPLQRAQFRQQLEKLAVGASRPEVARSLAGAVGASQPFFLPYQGECDRSLKATYGMLVVRLLQTANKAPDRRRVGRIGAGGKIRIGIVSGFFCDHTIWRLMLKGWLSEIDRGRFDIYAYHTSMMDDEETALARRLSTRFAAGRGTDFRGAILADQPDVLLYPELGMDPVAARLAGERLAPVQCVSWGQPETSGLPTIDFFLSSVLMEPEDAASHYTERLVTLPNLGIHYTPAERVTETCSRPALGLRDDAVIFWCGQALYKYLPQYDEVFARIATEVGDCQFLFIGFAKSRTVTDFFQSRLRHAFEELGLDADRHCVFLAPMSQERFLGTIRLADVILDSIGWSGGKSTLDALAEAPAIVTCPGPLMRGRHTMAILTRLGVTETIAETIDDYVSIAVRLARNPSMRASLRTQTAVGRHRVVADTEPIRALELFLTQAVERVRSTDRIVG
jgi:protein O-GlcNAc transferase